MLQLKLLWIPAVSDAGQHQSNVGSTCLIHMSCASIYLPTSIYIYAYLSGDLHYDPSLHYQPLIHLCFVSPRPMFGRFLWVWISVVSGVVFDCWRGGGEGAVSVTARFCLYNPMMYLSQVSINILRPGTDVLMAYTLCLHIHIPVCN